MAKERRVNYCGIDISTRNIDAVFVDANSDRAAWHRFPLFGRDAWERTRDVPRALVDGGFPELMETTIAVAIEEPAGKNPGRIFRVQGALLAAIPAATLAFSLMPSQWRRQVGIPGNAPKEDVEFWCRFASPAAITGQFTGCSWAEDAFDAYCLSLACSQLVETGEVAA